MELDDGRGPRDVLRGIDLSLEQGERVALMGRNGAGKTTLLRAAAGLVEPARGRISAPRGCALLAQSPGDLLVRERVADELPGEAGERGAGLGGARVGGGGRSARSVRRRAPAPGAGAGDGRAGRMDGSRGSSASTSRRGGWTGRARRSSRAGPASWRNGARASWSPRTTSSSRRCSRSASCCSGDGELIADGPVAEILSGGWYFATEVARILGAAGDLPSSAPRSDGRASRACRPSRSARGGEPRRGAEEFFVSWQLTAYALLALVLAGGFAWYERSRPPARMVALVAALAALAVAGRLVFAPIPNVVATTDIVLITGYAVGPAPGFAVGALAAAVSNLWLGQGPWTPWQMAGWGLVGLGGAALAVVTGRRLGRAGLAAACGLAGLAYGALLDLSVMVTYGGEQSLDRYLALSGRGIPFNVAHAVGNVALALAAGPALVRMISRYRSGSSSPGAMRRRRRAPAHAGRGAGGWSLLAARRRRRGDARRAGPGPGRAPPRPGTGSSGRRTPMAASAPRRRRLERGDHGLGRAGAGGAGRNPLDLRAGRALPIGYLRSEAPTCDSTGDLERTILALEGAGVNPRRSGAATWSPSFAGDAPERLVRGPGEPDSVRDPRPARRRRPPSALARSAAWLAAAQNADGGWGFQPRLGQRPGQHRGRAPGAGAAGGRAQCDRARGVYLRRAQRADGGSRWPGRAHQLAVERLGRSRAWSPPG